jgi:hypothetical protein
MASFTQFFPTSGQTDVARTTVISFTILDDSYGVQISTLSVTVDSEQVIQSGVFVNGFSGNIASGTSKYVVGILPRAPSFLPSASEIEVDINVLDAYDSLDSYGYSFFTAGYGDQPEVTIPSPPTRACIIGRPSFISNNVGLRLAIDKGVGTEVELRWNEASPYDDDNIVIYNIYYSTRRIEVFDSPPRFLVTDESAIIGGFAPGDTLFFSIRASEMDPSISSLSGLSQAGQNMYLYPSALLDGYLESTSTIVPVDSVDGFPEKGIIIIDDELIQYLSLRQFPPAFISDADSRGYAGSVAESHADESAVLLYKGREDENTIIAETTPTFQKPEFALTWVKSDGYGPDGYRDGYDGYDADGYDGYYFHRQVNRDILTTDGTNNDESGDFDRFDHCGSYRHRSPRGFWQGQCTGSYFGGVQLRDGVLVRESDVRTHMLQREELLLETTGEPFVLLRRLWTGIRCTCHMLRREHADQRCPICYGTGFVNGYEQFFNPRRTDSRILIRVDPAVDDLSIQDKGGLTPEYQPSCWTIAFPAIKDRDVLIRFNEDNTEAFRYEILDVTRVKAFFGQSGVQKFNMKRFHRTDVIYQIEAQRDTSPYSKQLVTGAAFGPGIPLHTHTITTSNNISISSLDGRTNINEKHNHVIRAGRVISVLGHTHTLST